MNLKIISLALFLVISNTSEAKTKMSKEEWLGNLKPLMVKHLCAKASPFIKSYKGDNCESDVESLFIQCSEQTDNVIIPSVIDRIEIANKNGQILAECVTAHYHGGALLDAFNHLQNLSNNK